MITQYALHDFIILHYIFVSEFLYSVSEQGAESRRRDIFDCGVEWTLRGDKASETVRVRRRTIYVIFRKHSFWLSSSVDANAF